MSSQSSQWSGEVELGRGWLAYRGPLGPVATHAHHAHQILRSDAATPLRLQDARGRSANSSVALIPANVPHAITRGASSAEVLLVDPLLVDPLLVDPHGAAGRALSVLARARSGDVHTWPALSREELVVVQDDLAAAAIGLASAASVHPLARRAIAAVTRRLPGPVSTSLLATDLGVSSGHLARVFVHEVGVTIRVYALWSRLLSVGAAIERGANIAQGAHEAGFADAAHLSRTFRRMFGISPSALVSATWRVHG